MRNVLTTSCLFEHDIPFKSFQNIIFYVLLLKNSTTVGIEMLILCVDSVGSVMLE